MARRMSRLPGFALSLLITAGLSVATVATALAAIPPGQPGTSNDRSSQTFMASSSTANPLNVGALVGVGGAWAASGALSLAANMPITVYLARTPGAKTWSSLSSQGDIVATATTDSSGFWETSFVIPERAGGAYDVLAVGSNDVAWRTGATALNIGPNLERSPRAGGPRTTVTLNGTGFLANEPGITVVFDSAPGGIQRTVASGITASPDGAWSASFTVPDRPAAAGLLITATGDSGSTFSVSFDVNRNLRLVPDSASPGATVSALARGMARSSAITFRLDNTVLVTVPATAASSADGRVVISFVLPVATAYGPHEITAADSGGEATAQLIVARPASIQITPNYSIRGDTVNIAGSGFSPSAPVVFTLDGSPLDTLPATVTTAADGSFTAVADLSEPKDPGYYSLVAADSNGTSAAAIYTVPGDPAPYQAETAMVAGVSADAGGNAYLGARIVRFFDPSTGNTVTPDGGISGFDASISYAANGVSVKAVTSQLPWPLVVGLNTAGGALTSVSSSGAGTTVAPPSELFRVFPWLTGSKDIAYTLTLRFNAISTGGGSGAPQERDIVKTFIRGDANNSGAVSIADALFIAQYLAGLRDLGETAATVNAINSAAVRNDSPAGSAISISDALFIAQMLAGLRDASYNMI